MPSTKDTYAHAFRRSMTFSDIYGHSTYFSVAEIYPNVQILRTIHETTQSPALYELSVTIDGEPRLIIVQQSCVELHKTPATSAGLTLISA